MVKEVFKSVMLAGNSSVLSTESNLTAKCPQTKPLEVVMMPSIHSSAKLELENMSLDASSSTLNPLSSMKSEQELTDNSSILNNSSLEKKMPPTILLEDTIQLEKRSSIYVLIELESLQTTARDCKDS